MKQRDNSSIRSAALTALSIFFVFSASTASAGGFRQGMDRLPDRDVLSMPGEQTRFEDCKKIGNDVVECTYCQESESLNMSICTYYLTTEEEYYNEP